MSITLEKVEKRVYVVGNSFSIKDKLKEQGCHWDAERKQWWIGAGKVSAIEHILKGQESQVSTPEAKPAEENLDSIKVIGKATYKGKTYYVRWHGYSEKYNGFRARLCTLDAKIDFWCAAFPHGKSGSDQEGAVITKTYQTRIVGYGKYAREEHTTLGSLRRFIERQKNPETRIGECCECGHRGPSGQRCTECGGEGSYM